MLYNTLGKTGLPISALSFGSWITFAKQSNNKSASDCMKLAYDSGINFFDNAEIYARGKSELLMGSILKKMQWPRDSYLLSSKVFFGVGKLPTQKGLHRKHIIEACHQALQRLKTEYLDLYFCHRPDPSVPVEEIVWMMHNLILQGKILYWGTSEWPAQLIEEALRYAETHHLIGPSMEQPQYNLLHRHRFEKEYSTLFNQRGMGTTIWSPLASGLLTGKYNQKYRSGTRLNIEGMEWLRDDTFGNRQKMEACKKIESLAAQAGIAMNHLSLCWCLKNKNVSTAIMGASKVSQLKDNLKALKHLEDMSDDLMQELNQISKAFLKSE
ncbi:MAG TPA: aldo/keto reductase [Bacteroidia bacterium]|nr:aldo/keto reductase [Bacteroidia bacterium]HNT80320.1 aldo/keto reductase [Bacteroidia bacterium]